MSIKGRTTGIFVYGYNLNPDGSLGIGTKRRLLGALQIHMQTPHSVIVAAAGISPDVPAQMVPMHTLIAEFLARYPFISVHEAAELEHVRRVAKRAA